MTNKLTFYTVLDRPGFPVKFCAPEDYRIQTFRGPFGGPGDASQEFKLTQTHETCYLPEKSFAAKAKALAELRRAAEASIDPELVVNSLKTLDKFPIKLDSGGNDWFLCPFCFEEGIFATGPCGIEHTHECAITLAQRINLDTMAQNVFDQLAVKEILQQLALMSSFPQKKTGPDKYEHYCPFCDQLEIDHIAKIIQHSKTCIVLLAQAQRSA